MQSDDPIAVALPSPLASVVDPESGERRRHRSAIWAVGTAVPGEGLAQTDILEFMRRAHAADPKLRRRLGALYQRSGIERRYSCLAERGTLAEASAFYPAGSARSPSTARRMAVFREAAAPLAARAVDALLGEFRGFDVRRVTHLIVASCTGFYAPGPDVDLVHRLRLSPHVARTLIGFQGCHAGLAGLRLADAICCADQQSIALLVCVELSTLHFQIDASDDNLLANSLFGDGAAAVLVAAEKAALRSGCGDVAAGGGRRLTILRTGSWLKAGTRQEMSWSVGDRGFEMGLSALVPRLLGQDIASFLDSALAIHDPGRLAFWAVHPGGPAILHRVERAMGLEPRLLESSRSVLRDFGNMSSPTIFFVLDRIRRGLTPGQRGVACAFGPGLSIEGVLLATGDGR